MTHLSQRKRRKMLKEWQNLSLIEMSRLSNLILLRTNTCLGEPYRRMYKPKLTSFMEVHKWLPSSVPQRFSAEWNCWMRLSLISIVWQYEFHLFCYWNHWNEHIRKHSSLVWLKTVLQERRRQCALKSSQRKWGATCLLFLKNLGHVSKYLSVKYVSLNHNFNTNRKHKADG